MSNTLESLLDIEGCVGVALFDADGAVIDSVSSPGVNLKAMGALANNLLNNAQKASLEMGTGAGQLVHVEGSGGHVMARGITDERNPLRIKLGLVVALKSNGNLGLTKLKSGSVLTAALEAH